MALLSIYIFAQLSSVDIYAGLMASAVSISVATVMALLLRSLKLTRYVIRDGELLIEASRLIGGPKSVSVGDIRSIERVSRIPFGLRLFGASLHGGHYYVPGLGRVFMAITNFSDGVLIKTRDKTYVITPSAPQKFIQELNSRRGSAYNSTMR